jgi:phage terminase Nu1 subunit (DNA packaging protein)
MMPCKEAPSDASPLCAAVEIARAFGVSQQRVSQWKSAGMPFSAAGRITLAAALAWVLERDRQGAARMRRSEAQERLAIAKAELAELQLARELAAVCLTTEVVEAAEYQRARVLRAVRAMPERYGPHVAARLRCSAARAVAALREIADELCVTLGRNGADPDDEEQAA